jgi:hypothetical protein
LPIARLDWLLGLHDWFDCLQMISEIAWSAS